MVNCIYFILQDEEEQNIKDLEKKALEHAKTAVLDCPMCGKPCKTENVSLL